MDPVTDLLEAAEALIRLTEGSRARRARAITKLKRKVANLFRARFRAQRAAILKNTWLKKELSEAAAAPALPKKKLPGGAVDIVSSEISGLTLTGTQIELFNDTVAETIRAGAKDVAASIGKTADTGLDSYIGEYLKSGGGLQRVSADIDKTTVEHVSSAMAGAYENNGSYDDVVSAIKDAYDFSDKRANAIAQTELNDAFSQGQLQFARDAGAEGKSWDPDGDACEICMGNVEDGIIPIDDDFSSGDDAPTAHTFCDCGLNIHATAEDEAGE